MEVQPACSRVLTRRQTAARTRRALRRSALLVDPSMSLSAARKVQRRCWTRRSRLILGGGCDYGCRPATTSYARFGNSGEQGDDRRESDSPDGRDLLPGRDRHGLLGNVLGDVLDALIQGVSALCIVGYELPSLGSSNRSDSGWRRQFGLGSSDLLDVESQASQPLTDAA